jgi:hypothetical protein
MSYFCRISFSIFLPFTSVFSYLLTPWSTVLLGKLTGSQLEKKFPAFVAIEGSLPLSQVPTTNPYFEQDRPSPGPPPKSRVLSGALDIIVPSTPGSSKWTPSLRFPHQNLHAPVLCPIRATCPAHVILLDLIARIIFGEE